jgi:hypothetical protein
MLGLPGLVVLAVEVTDGEIETTVETTRTKAWCRSCGVRAVGHGRREVVVRDIDVFDRHARCGGASASGAAPSRRVRR